MEQASKTIDNFKELLEDEHHKWTQEDSQSKAFNKISETFLNIMYMSQLAEKETRKDLNDIHNSDKWTMETGKPLAMFDDNIFLKAITTVLNDDFEPPHDCSVSLEHYFTALLTLYGKLFTHEDKTPVSLGMLMKAQAESMEISFSLGMIAGRLEGGRGKLKGTQKTKKLLQDRQSENTKAILKIHGKLIEDGRINEDSTMESRYDEIKKYMEGNKNTGIKHDSRTTILAVLRENI